MGFFLSLSSPHLGIKLKQSTVVSAGLWFIQKMRKSLSLDQLAMNDNSNI